MDIGEPIIRNDVSVGEKLLGRHEIAKLVVDDHGRLILAVDPDLPLETLREVLESMTEATTQAREMITVEGFKVNGQ